MARVFSLSFHADYRCRHSGECCTVGWDVPVEVPVYRSLTDALARRNLHVSTAATGLDPFIVEPDLPDEAGAILERTDAGHCVFFEGGSGLCIVHRDLGEPALPDTCRHFPRVSVQDRRGTFVSLSHFCPTAASMLFRDDVAVEIVESPPAFPRDDYDGLVVSDEDLPPLLHPRMLTDLDGYAAWEAHMVRRCADVRQRPESVIATLRRDAAMLAGWKPREATLADAIAALPEDVVDADPDLTLARSLQLHGEVMRAVPDDIRPQPDEAGLEDAYRRLVRAAWDRFRAPLDRYLAAKAFASWTAYQGRGVATIVRGLDAALALVRVEASRVCRNAGRDLDRDALLEAIRAADFALNHLAVGEELAAAWASAETLHRSGAWTRSS